MSSLVALYQAGPDLQVCLALFPSHIQLSSLTAAIKRDALAVDTMI